MSAHYRSSRERVLISTTVRHRVTARGEGRPSYDLGISFVGLGSRRCRGIGQRENGDEQKNCCEKIFHGALGDKRSKLPLGGAAGRGGG